MTRWAGFRPASLSSWSRFAAKVKGILGGPGNPSSVHTGKPKQIWEYDSCDANPAGFVFFEKCRWKFAQTPL